MYNNQGNYQQFGQRLPLPPPFQQGHPASQHPITQQSHPSIPPHVGQNCPLPYALASPASMQQGPPVSVPPSGMLTSSQSYLISPPPPPPQNSNWNQNQHISPPIPPPGRLLTPRIPPPHQQGQQFYRVPPPPLLPLLPPPPTSSYFTPAPFGSFGHLPPPPLPPPPPPPSSPPPGLPPLPPSSPPPNSPLRPSSEYLSTTAELGPTSRNPSVVDLVASGVIDRSNGDNGSATSVKVTSDVNIMSDISSPPPKPRDEKIVRKIEVLCQYIAKNGHEFEDMTREKEVDNPEFNFLFGGAPGSEAAISHDYFKWVKKNCSSSELLEGGNNRNLSLEPLGVGSSGQPDGSMHADISHSPAGSDMDMEDDITQPEEPGKLFGSAKSKPTFISNEVDIRVEEHGRHACDLEHMSHNTDGNLSCPGSSGVMEQGANLSEDDLQFEKSSMKVGVSHSDWSSKAEQDNISLYQEMNQSDASNSAAEVKKSSDELIRGTSPFRLIQGYASDDGSENDSEPHLENVSPEPVSLQIKEDTESKDSLSKLPEPSRRTQDLEEKTGSYLVIDLKQKDRLKDDDDDTGGSKNGGARKEDRKSKLEVDEFGRMVKAGASDSDSDDYTRRRRKRGRSRSRSRSPIGRRRRKNRSRSRSWSPKKRSRSRSRSPYRYGGGAGADLIRRNRSQLPVCFDFRRGKCFRGESCRYLHESEKNDESRRHKNKQHYQRVKEEFVDPASHSDAFVSPHETLDVDKLVQNSNDEIQPNTAEHLATDQRSNIPGQLSVVDQTSPVKAQLPLPPLSQDSHAPIPSQLHRDYNVMPTSNYSSHSASAEIYPPLSSEHSEVSVPLVSSWNPLPPPPPRPQLSQLPPPMNYPFQTFVRPYPPALEDFRPRTFPVNYPIPQPPAGPMIFSEENSQTLRFSRDPPTGIMQSLSGEIPVPSSEDHAYLSRYSLQNPVPDSIQLSGISDFGRSRISTHYNPYASTFDQPLSTKFSSGAFSQETGTSYNNYGAFARNSIPRSGGDQYDPLFDSIEPSLNSFRKSDHGNKIEGTNKVLDLEEKDVENDEFGETADAEVGAVENDSPTPSSPIDIAPGEIEIEQVKTKKSKDSRSMKLFKVALADFVKEVLKPSWRQGNMSKEAFKTIVKKTVDKVSGAMKKHQLPKSHAKINQYIDSSQRKLTKLVMGYVDKYVKV